MGIVGLGEMGRLAAEYFGSARPQRLLLTNRTEAKAHDLAHKMRAEAITAEVSELRYLIEQSDVIVLAVSGSLAVEYEVLRALSQRIFIDLSVPPALKALATSDHYYFGVDDLEKIAQENRSFRESELQQAEEIIQQETNRFWASLRAFLFHELFESIESRMSGIRTEELKALRSRLSDVSDSDWIEVEKMAERMVSRVLQEPMKTVKAELEAKQVDDGEGVVTFFRHLFKI